VGLSESIFRVVILVICVGKSFLSWKREPGMINAHKISVGNSGNTAFGTLTRRQKDNPETGLEQNAGWFQAAQYRLQCAAFVNNEMNRVV